MNQDSSGTKLPPDFLDRLRRIVPKDRLEDVLTSFAVIKPTTFRINTLADSRSRILAAISDLGVEAQPVEWLRDEAGEVLAYRVSAENRELITHSSLADSGKIYIQNPSSMLATVVLDPQPGETVLDLAAAPGGKTIHIAERMKNQGILSAVEPVRNRMFKLKANLKRCHVSCAKTYQTDGRTVGKKTPERFDRVLLDAPCSSESRFRAGEPKSWATWSLRKLRETSRKQVGLLKAAVHATKPGGRIVYCTCSFSPEENERVVSRVLKKLGDVVQLQNFELPIDNVMNGISEFEGQSFDPQVRLSRRILPNDTMDGFFIACLEKG